MSKIMRNLGNKLVRVGLSLGGQVPSKTLRVIFHFGPSFELLADYYDSAWSPRDGAMFGKSYPLRHRVLAVHEAVQYARDNNYNLLQVDTMEWNKSLKTVGQMHIH